jgi:hypothetical protein
VRQSIAGPLVFVSAQEFGFSPALRSDVWTSAAQFQDPLAFGLHASGSRHDFELSAVQISGLPGNDRPVNHTVILHLARSFILARWRHAFSLKTRGSGGHRVRLLPRSHDHMVRSEFPPSGGAVRSVMPRQVQLMKP